MRKTEMFISGRYPWILWRAYTQNLLIGTTRWLTKKLVLHPMQQS